MSDGGKGSKPRPFSVSNHQFSTNWDRIFNKEKYENGDQRINSEGKLEQYHEGYWSEIENRN